MDSKKKLIESRETDPEVTILAQRNDWVTHPFVRKWMENRLLEMAEPEMGAARGQTVGDAVGAGAGAQVAATLEIFNAVIRGFTRYMDDSFVRKYTTDKVQFKIPKTEYRELAGAISAGELPHTEKMIDYATFDLSNPESEKGGKVTWTRALLEDVTFDVQAEMAEGMGHAIAKLMMSDILTALTGVSAEQMPFGQKRLVTSGAITWEQFLNIVADVDVGVEAVSIPWDAGTDPVNSDIGKPVTDDTALVGYLKDFALGAGTTGILYIHLTKVKTAIADNSVIAVTGGTGSVTASAASTSLGKRTYGPADYALVSTDIYWQLLNIIQMTNVLYEGSTDPVRLGVIRLALGVTIVKQSILPANTVVALNSQKAIGLVTRRALKIEPVIFPVWNEYGFIGTVRYATSVIYGSAIQIGDPTGA